MHGETLPGRTLAPAVAGETALAQEATATERARGFAGMVAEDGLGRATAMLLDALHPRPAVRQSAERAAERKLGVHLPLHPDARAIFRGRELAADAGPAAADRPELVAVADSPAHEGGALAEDCYTVLCPAGTIVLLHYDVVHKGSPRLPRSLWRPMMKLKFLRTSAPPPQPAPARSLTWYGGSPAEEHIWQAMWDWLHGSGGAPAAAVGARALPPARSVAEEATDVGRVGACYALGGAARGGSQVGLARLDELLLHGKPAVQRAAMHGLAAAGAAAVPLLLELLRGPACTTASAPSVGLDTAVRALFVLGEAAAPATEGFSFRFVVDTVAAILCRWQANLLECIAAAAPPPPGGRIGPLAGWHRAVAACVQCLSVLAERAPACAAAKIAQLLLPFTLVADPIGDGTGAVPRSRMFTGSANAGFWISEQAAIGLLRLASRGGGRPQPALVKRSSPASQVDQRFVQGLCLLALERSLAADPRSALSGLLQRSRPAWLAVYAAAGGTAVDNRAAGGGAEGDAAAPLHMTEWY
jgi:hypothetical protein